MKKSEAFLNIITNKVFMSVVAIIVLVVVIYFLFFFKKNLDEKKIENALTDEEKNAGKEIDPDTGVKMLPTFQLSEYLDKANTLYLALGSYSWIDDNPKLAISTLKQMQNNIDIIKLKSAYGKRQNKNFGIAVGNEMDLYTMLRDQLGSSEIEEVNKYFTSKSITYSI